MATGCHYSGKSKCSLGLGGLLAVGKTLYNGNQILVNTTSTVEVRLGINGGSQYYTGLNFHELHNTPCMFLPTHVQLVQRTLPVEYSIHML